MQTLNTVYKFLQIVKQQPEVLPNLIDSVSDGQLKSKEWLIDEVSKLDIDLGTIFLCAGWYATLANMMFDTNLKIEKFRSFDIDPSCAAIAESINREQVINDWKFKASTINIQDLSYDNFTYITNRKDGSSLSLTETADTIINTSCEHITQFDEWYSKIPAGKLVIVQTNNFVELKEHVNCSISLNGFAKLTPMTNALYEGELPLDKYTRFMRIGIK